MTEGEVSRLVQLPLSRTFFHGTAQDIVEGRLHQRMDGLALRVCLLIPFRRVAQGVCDPFAHDTLVEDPLAEFEKETAYPRATVCKILDREMFPLDGIEECLRYPLHPLQSQLTYLLQLRGVLFEEPRLCHDLLEFAADRLVFVLEDGASELFDLSDDIPTAVVGNVLDDIVHNPLQDHILGRETVDQLIHRQFLHLIVVQSDVERGREVQFSGQVAQDRLEERVDGHHAELMIVMDEMV